MTLLAILAVLNAQFLWKKKKSKSQIRMSEKL